MKKNTLALISLLAAGLVILLIVFSKVIAEPNSYLFSQSEDAVKSYYNFSFYLEYDRGIRHDGINYPYGDHLLYINSHPLYIQILKLTDKFIPLHGKGVGILNLTMIISLFLALPFIYLILRKFFLPPWYSAVITLIILFLSPQVDRLGGHFEMVYAFFIPLYWYLLLRWDEGNKRGLWTLLLILTSLVGGFTSVYYAAFLAIFPMAILLVQAWKHRKNLRAYMHEGILLLAIAVVPLIVVKGFVSATDWVDDRPDNPWGFFIFHSNIFSIFLPPRSILREVTENFAELRYRWEGRAYVGFPALLLALVIAISTAYQLIRGKGMKQLFFLRNDPVNLYLLAAVIVLLFAMCIPFLWFRFLPELLPPLKQFRCLGRFSWIFYYVFTVYTALLIYRFYRWLRIKGYAIAAIALPGLLLFYWGLEAALNVKSSTHRIFNPNTLITHHGNEVNQALKSGGFHSDDFQAIMFLPFASTCGDKLLFTGGMHAFSQAMKCGYQTGIPLIQSFSPRLSFAQAMSSIQLLADSSIYKTRVDDMSGKDILLVVSRDALNGQEKRLAEMGDYFWKGDQYSLAKLPVNAFNAGHGKWLDQVRTMADSLDYEKAVGSTVPVELILYEGFEAYHARHVFTGKGASYLRKGSVELFNKELYPDYGDQEVEFSFWLYTDSRKDNMPTPELWRLDGSGSLVSREKLDSRSIHNVDGMWVRVAHTLNPEPGIRYHLTLRGEFITVDDLLLKPASARVAIRENGNILLFDNFRVPVDQKN